MEMNEDVLYVFVVYLEFRMFDFYVNQYLFFLFLIICIVFIKILGNEYKIFLLFQKGV